MTTGVSVRALASPGFALALVVLVLNDHVLKTAYPGWITGKLSDVAGLVVAPLLLGVLLTAWRVPRPMLVAIAVVGLGFTRHQDHGRGGRAPPARLWSLTGVPTLIRADVTDLLALPALYGAWLMHASRVSERARATGESTRGAAPSGVALVPVTAVLATAATVVRTTRSIRRVGPDRRAAAGSRPDLRTDVRCASVFSWNEMPRLSGQRSRRVEARRVASDLPERRAPRRGSIAACDDDGTCWRIDLGADDVPAGPGLRPTTARPGVTWSHAADDRRRRGAGGRRDRVRRRGPDGSPRGDLAVLKVTATAVRHRRGRRRGRSARPHPPRRAGTC